MSKMNFRPLIFTFTFLLAAQIANAQGDDNIKATVDKKKILIGEPVQLTIEANFHPASAISFVQIDSIEHFEFLEKPVMTNSNYNGRKLIKGVYKLTSFDSGHWVIPSYVLSPAVKTDTIPIDVVFSDFNPHQDYHDIKDIMEVTPPKKKPWWWYIAGGALLLATVSIYLLRKKKPVTLPAPGVVVDPYEEAMKQLELLQKDKPDAKKYHSKLTDIFRLYVFRKKGILSLQKTTTDLVLQLRELNISKEQFYNLSQALRVSDFVKFARYIPTHEDDTAVFEVILNTIKIIEQLGS